MRKLIAALLLLTLQATAFGQTMEANLPKPALPLKKLSQDVNGLHLDVTASTFATNYVQPEAPKYRCVVRYYTKDYDTEKLKLFSIRIESYPQNLCAEFDARPSNVSLYSLSTYRWENVAKSASVQKLNNPIKSIDPDTILYKCTLDLMTASRTGLDLGSAKNATFLKDIRKIKNVKLHVQVNPLNSKKRPEREDAQLTYGASINGSTLVISALINSSGQCLLPKSADIAEDVYGKTANGSSALQAFEEMGSHSRSVLDPSVSRSDQDDAGRAPATASAAGTKETPASRPQ